MLYKGQVAETKNNNYGGGLFGSNPNQNQSSSPYKDLNGC